MAVISNRVSDPPRSHKYFVLPKIKCYEPTLYVRFDVIFHIFHCQGWVRTAFREIFENESRKRLFLKGVEFEDAHLLILVGKWMIPIHVLIISGNIC